MDCDKITGQKMIFLVSILILLANTAEIVLLLRTRKSKNNAMILLCSLAVADAILGITTASTIGMRLFWKRSISLVWYIQRSLFYGNIFASSFIVILISVDRWIAVKWPLKYRLLMTRKRIYVGSLLSWLLAFLVIPVSLAKDVALVYIASPLIILTVLIVIYFYCSLFYVYRRSVRTMKIYGNTRNVTQQGSKACKKHGKDKIEDHGPNVLLGSCHRQECECEGRSQHYVISLKNVRKMAMSRKEMQLLNFCVVIVVCFSMSYMPLGLVFLVFGSQSKKIPKWLIYVISVNSMYGSLLNPLLYFFFQLFCKSKLCRATKRKETTQP